MKYSIVFCSRTGNTALLGERLKSTLPQKDLVYYGEPKAAALEADLIFVGFWTDKGSSDEASSTFLKTLRGKQVFLFGTAGFGGSEEYFAQILARVQTNLDSSNTVAGSYLCQGKMPMTVRQRYEAMAEQQPEKMQPLLENFDRALSHPDEADLARLTQVMEKYIK